LADSADRLLTLLLNFAARRAGLIDEKTSGAPNEAQPEHLDKSAALPGVALLAMGSYGRRELAPFSDIDLLLLHSEELTEEKLENFVGNLLRPLWDCG